MELQIEDLFIDSGAWSLFRKYVLKRGAEHRQMGLHGRPLEERDNPSIDFSFYDLSPGTDFRVYCDRYASFMKAMEGRITLFANVDAIGNPDLTWEAQKYFENEHGLRPMPVVHRGSHLRYLDRYIEKGYDYIGLGGFASGIGGWRGMREWCDRVFIHICPESNGFKPVVGLHGFAMTGWKGIRRWPWKSVDSTSWIIWPANGWIPVPRWNARQEWRYDVPPMVINACPGSNTRKSREHMETVSKSTRIIFDKWVEYCGVPAGSVDKEGKMKEWGFTSHADARVVMNLKYFQELEASIPEWPWHLSEKIRQRPRGVSFGL